jgi:SAM-dependent methyltransferase
MDEHIVLRQGKVQRVQGDLIHDIPKDLTDWTAKHNWYASRECQDIARREAATALDGQAGRKRWLKQNVYLRLPLLYRAFFYWFYRYFLRLGFLDGKEGLIYHFLQAFWYRFLVDAKLYELGKAATVAEGGAARPQPLLRNGQSSAKQDSVSEPRVALGASPTNPMCQATSKTLEPRGSCPICGSLAHVTQVGFQAIPVLRCLACGLMYSGATLSARDLDLYYQEEFGGRRHKEGQIVNSRVNLRVLRDLLDLDAVRKIMDVGTGYGFLPRELRDTYDVEVVGIEPSRTEAAFAREVSHIEVHSCLLSEAGLPRDSFDLVTSFEVVEHTRFPVEFIHQLASYVRPGGHLVVMTDNFDASVVRRMGPEWPKWIPHSHITHFTPATLRKCFSELSGYSVVSEISYTPWENLISSVRCLIRKPRPAAECFDLREVLSSEMVRSYPLFRFRKTVNPLWYQATHTCELGGALMYVCAQRQRF